MACFAADTPPPTAAAGPTDTRGSPEVWSNSWPKVSRAHLLAPNLYSAQVGQREWLCGKIVKERFVIKFCTVALVPVISYKVQAGFLPLVS